MRTVLVAMLVVGIGGCGKKADVAVAPEVPAPEQPAPASEQPPIKDDLPKPLPDEIVKAWTDAGADVGWVTLSVTDYPYRPEPKTDTVPVLVFNEKWDWKGGIVATLPSPDGPFGLKFHRTPVSNGDLRELARFTHLASLDLGGIPVTDAWLRELAPLKGLRTLRLGGVGGTSVTDAGLQDLAAFPRLSALDISGTLVTDDGLKELTALKNRTCPADHVIDR